MRRRLQRLTNDDTTAGGTILMLRGLLTLIKSRESERTNENAVLS
ncbi:hypothetical protein [Kosmotoga arenicorallina]|nr:hypothetical protein [Kosmotoga arenicorallina]